MRANVACRGPGPQAYLWHTTRGKKRWNNWVERFFAQGHDVERYRIAGETRPAILQTDAGARYRAEAKAYLGGLTQQHLHAVLIGSRLVNRAPGPGIPWCQ